MNIRIAERKDLDSIVEIYNQAIASSQKTADVDPVTVEDRVHWFEEHPPEKYPILVAEVGELIVGYLTLSAYRPGRMALRSTAEVSFYIHFEHHRQGIGSGLLQHAISLCPKLGIKTLFGILLDSNEGSVKILEKHEFQKWGHLPRVAEFEGEEVGHFYYGLRIDKN